MSDKEDSGQPGKEERGVLYKRMQRVLINKPFIILVYITLHISSDIGDEYSTTCCMFCDLGSQRQMQRYYLTYFFTKLITLCRPSSVASPIGISVKA